MLILKNNIWQTNVYTAYNYSAFIKALLLCLVGCKKLYDVYYSMNQIIPNGNFADGEVEWGFSDEVVHSVSDGIE